MTSPSSPDPASSADRVDRGLAAGFGPWAPESVAGDSILAALAQRSGVTPQVQLRDAPEGGAPLLRPLPPKERAAETGRYQFQGEIARGGVGVILKGHDQDLGRDVAIKVLHERYKDDASLLRRFVEEAQIGGQLQHPGIVPVYELGLHDGRPFFTMKLIKGRTLAALLAERADPSRDRRRFLGIFEQVCQTMAYAHARGVIHRDLKPANVMVGAFGEVQVVDWGMAKVLSQGGVADERKARQSTVETVRSRAGTPPGTSSVAGSVMGTPSYMPPEQATGDVEHMDERSDVFALGAILCEILTGVPPYTGGRDDVLAMAAQGQLDAARERLARSAGEAELSALVSECLSPAVESRPRNAQAVAARVSAYLASAEQRAQAARIAAAEQGVKTREARRAQRLTLGLAASVLVTVVVGGGGYSWVAGQRAARGAAIARQVDEALAEATRLRGQAEAGTAEALGLWGQARTKAEAAQALTASGDADAGLRVRVAVMVGELEIGEGEARRKAEQLARDRQMVARLEEIPIPVDDDIHLTAGLARRRRDDAQRRENDYRAAFADYGLDPEADEQTLVQRIAQTRIAKELALALDDWSAARKTLRDDPEPCHRLRRIARHVDADAWRNRLREWLLRDDPDMDALRKLADEAEPAHLPASTLLLLARTLSEHEAIAEATQVLRSAQRRYASDFMIASELGLAVQRHDPPDWRDAVVFLTAAVAIRPHSTEALHRLGLALVEGGRFDDALALFRNEPAGGSKGHWSYHVGGLLSRVGDVDGAVAAYRSAISGNPAEARAHHGLSNVLLDKGDMDGALAACHEALRLDRDYAVAHNALGRIRHRSGDLDGAVAAYREAIRLQPDTAIFHNNLGGILCDKADFQGALAACREALRLKPDYVSAYDNLSLALLRTGDVDGSVAACREAIRLQPDDAVAHNNLGSALHARADHVGAVAACREAIRLKPDHAVAYNNLGNALSDTGDLDGAIKAYREALRLKPDYALAHDNLGNALLETNDVDGAIQAYREAIRLKPDHAVGHGNLANALGRHGDLPGAILSYREAIRLKPDFAAAHRALAGALRRQGDLEGAIVAYREAIRLRPDSNEARQHLGLVLISKGDLDGAIAVYREAIRMAPADAAVHASLGDALFRRRDFDAAVAACQEALRLKPDLVQGHVTLGCAIGAKGDLDGQLIVLREAIRLDPDHALAHYTLGTALLTSGDLEGAEAAYRNAIRCGPKMAEAWCNLGHTLQRRGLHAEALEVFDHGHQLGSRQQRWPYPSAEWLATARALTQQERPLLAIVRGEAVAQDAKQSVSAATCAMRRKLHQRAAQLYADAFAADPALAANLKAEHRYQAARMAAVTGCGTGSEPLTDEARANWRQQAVRWLRDELEAWRRHHEGDPEARRGRVERSLQRWQTDAAFAGLRDPTAVEKLPAGEQADCLALWRDVAALLDQTRPERPPESRR